MAWTGAVRMGQGVAVLALVWWGTEKGVGGVLGQGPRGWLRGGVIVNRCPRPPQAMKRRADRKYWKGGRVQGRACTRLASKRVEGYKKKLLGGAPVHKVGVRP